MIASSSKDKIIKLWDVSTKKYLNTLNGNTDLVVYLCFTLDAKTLIGSSYQCILFWDIKKGKLINTLKI
jgi:WD40 repeat protein